jgi:hypothetical protein
VSKELSFSWEELRLEVLRTVYREGAMDGSMWKKQSWEETKTRG